MKRINVLVLVLCAGIISAFAQQNEMTPMSDADIAAFEKKIAAEMQKINTIESDFTQIKRMTTTERTVTSSGRFYYQREGKVCLDYFAPKKQQIIINDNNLKMVSGGKTRVQNIAFNRLLKETKEIVSASMTGNLQAMKRNYKMEYFQSPREYLVKITPINPAIKTVLDEVYIYFDKRDLLVNRMRVIEASKNPEVKNEDYTEYMFQNKRINVHIPASRFN